MLFCVPISARIESRLCTRINLGSCASKERNSHRVIIQGSMFSMSPTTIFSSEDAQIIALLG